MAIGKLPPTDGRGWDRLGFVMVNPDGMARGLAMDVLDRLEASGFTVHEARLVRVLQTNVMALHADVTSIEISMLPTYRLELQLFDFGPSIAMSVTRDGEVDGSVHEGLRRFKGSADPHLSAPGTLRHDLRGINHTLRIVHCSESAREAKRSYDLFLRESPTASTRTDIRRLVEIAAYRPEPERRGFVSVLASLRARLLAILWDDLAPAGRQLVTQWASQTPAALAGRGAGLRLLPFLSNGDHPAARLLQSDFRPPEGLDCCLFEEALAVLGVRLDAWEKLVLMSSCEFKPLEW